MALDQRCYGILLPVFSLPGGTLDSAPQFIEFLATNGAAIWQVLPLGPTQADLSPYLALSVNAGNPDLIGLKTLSSHVGRDIMSLEEAFTLVGERDSQSNAYFEFCEQNKTWLSDYALFMTLREKHDNDHWMSWPKMLRQRSEVALSKMKQKFSSEISFHTWLQYIFYQQWEIVRTLCHRANIKLFGDIPLYVSHDSVDVWRYPNLFQLNEDGSTAHAAGVPPDYFSPEGQFWGNPIYDWQEMESTGYEWWINRMDTQSRLFDIVRIDHFRALESYWDIPPGAETALEGKWVKGPGEKFLSKLLQNLDVDLVAEDLGTITQEVDSLRRQFNLPGIRVLQFGFDGVADNPHNGLNVDPAAVLYTGTHDNDTSVGWYNTLPGWQREMVNQALAGFSRPFPQSLVACLFSNHVAVTIVPIQDLLGLDSSARINTPGTIDINWTWQLDLEWPKADASDLLNELRSEYNR